MTTPRPNYRIDWHTCPNCLVSYKGIQDGLCPRCLPLTEPLTTWGDITWWVRVYLYGLILLVVMFVVRVASDFVTLLKGWWR
jgi:hypothetical protein